MSLDDSELETGSEPGHGTEPETARPVKAYLSEVRDVSDARTLRALTHPVRIALLEALGLGGAMTATQLGEQIGESPTTCSFHLRQLAKYGFVEEAGGGKGRARPWKMTSIGMNIRGHGDPETEIAAATLGRLVTDRQIARYQAWTRSSASYPKEWRQAAGSNEWILFLTPDELQQLNDELAELIIPRFRERFTDPSKRPPGALPVEYLLFSYPVAVPGADAGRDPEGGQPPPA
jgi:DNA-binding transcriptional ArsR family regulator